MKTYDQLSEKDKLTYDQDGYLIAREFYSSEEAELLLNSYLNDRVYTIIPMAGKTRMEIRPGWLYGTPLTIISTVCLPGHKGWSRPFLS